MKLPQKLKLELPYVPAIPLWGIFSEENKNTNSKRYIYIYTHTHPCVHCSVIFNSQDMEATISRCSYRICSECAFACVYI